MQPTGFYIGKKGAIYAQLENGSLARLGLRFTGGKLVAFDPLRREWIELPTHIPDRSGGSVTITVTEERWRDPYST